jgi:hypothetical protein
MVDALERGMNKPQATRVFGVNPRRQEYECSFEETEDAVFTTEMIDGAISPDVKPLFGAAAAAGGGS